MNKEYNWVNWFFSKYVGKLVEKKNLGALNFQVKFIALGSFCVFSKRIFSCSFGEGVSGKQIQSLILYVVELQHKFNAQSHWVSFVIFRGSGGKELDWEVSWEFLAASNEMGYLEPINPVVFFFYKK